MIKMTTMKEYTKPEMEIISSKAGAILAGSLPANDDIPADGTQPIYAPKANELFDDEEE